MSKHEIIGSGQEHLVFKSKLDGWLLKKPRALTYFIFNLATKNPFAAVEREMEIGRQRLFKSGINFPEYKLFKFGQSYVIAQKFINEDRSLSPGEILSKLVEAGDQFLIDQYLRDPNNFFSNNKKIYCVDVTYGLNRILANLGLMSVEKQKHLSAKVKQFLNF